MINYSIASDKPLFRLIIPFIAGILTGYYLQLVQTAGVIILLILYLILFIRLALSIRSKLLQNPLDLNILFLIFFAGYFYMRLHLIVPEYNEVKITWKGFVEEKPEKGDKYTKAVCSIYNMSKAPEREKAGIKVLVYIENNPATESLDVGDQIQFHTYLQRIMNTGNPHEFDYARYMQSHNIYYRAFANKEDFLLIKAKARYKLKRKAIDVRTSLLRWFENCNMAPDELSVLSALMLGYRELLSPEIKERYSNAGAIHVMAVSGLHVGILYMILTFLLHYLNSKFILRLLRFLIISLVIWLYAILTGMSPSVIRAAVMFSIYGFGTLIARKPSAYNVLAISALLMLLINPMVVFDVGFQFSYTAVLSILYFQPLLYKIILIKSVFIDRIYQLITVSVAAQIGTLPLSLYYFHQFPVYFWLTNILLIPLVFIIVCLAVMLIILFWLKIPASFTVNIINFLLKCLNGWVLFVDKLPGSTIKNIDLPIANAILLASLIIYLVYMIEFRPKVKLAGILVFVVVFVSVDIFKELKLAKDETLVFYNSSKGICIGYHQADNSRIILNTEAKSDNFHSWYYKNDLLFRRNMKQHELIYLPSTDTLTENKENYFIDINHKHRVLIACNNTKIDSLRGSIDYLYIGSSDLWPDNAFVSYYNPKKVILNSTLSYYKREKWRKQINNEGTQVIDLTKYGAYQIHTNNNLN